MTRIFCIAPLFALALSACSVDVGGRGDVTVDQGSVDGDNPRSHQPAINTDDDPSAPGAASGNPTTSQNPGSAEAGQSALDAGGVVITPPGDASLAVDATPGKPDTKPMPAVDGGTLVPAAVDGGASVTPEPAFALTSPAFDDGMKIPAKHTCNAADVSPAFAWSGAPAGTELFALVLTLHTNVWGNPANWTRWVMWNIPATYAGLPAMIEEGHSPESLPGTLQASNETDTLSRYGNGGGSFGAGGFAGGAVAGGNMGAGGNTGAGGNAGAGGSGSSDDARAGRRYRGPCSYGFAQTFEFTLYALAKAPAAPSWYLGITPDEIASWLGTKATVLGKAQLKGIAP